MVTLDDHLQEFLFVNLLSIFTELFRPSAHAFSRIGIKVKLPGSPGKHYGSRIPPLGHNISLFANILLHLSKLFPHRRQSRDPGCQHGHFRAANLVTDVAATKNYAHIIILPRCREKFQGNVIQAGTQRGFIIKINSSFFELQSYGPVHGTGVQVGEGETRRHPAADG